ncbi:3-ketoacyl-CoA thiolase, peroxisomal isoform X3 [Boleophthalmus pectinirostris]|uniref:3-ketoacyl-CoA thiolase, peroxisomal isoform X3 n=1 Tax=Boleophthalmus pectinirostris TaxID=150288 RepID=UPI00242CA1E8|nr:3-ketoacyl-CoA thiolase, peroxisomal isoform X3 [Boleophthalmus pectinirostris]
MHRLQVLSGHLRPPGQSPGPAADVSGLRSSVCGAAGRDGPDDVVIVHGRRTAIGKAKRGSFKDTTPDELLSAVMKAVVSDLNLSPDQLGDVCVGNVLQPGAGAVMARVAHFLSGFPEQVPVYTVNRQCSSGLQAVLNIAGAVQSGVVDLGLACGVESMSLRSMTNPGDLSSRVSDVDKARDCLIPMGITSENVAQEFGISREKQDAFALRSHQRAARAQSQGLFKEEIVPVQTRIVDESGAETQVLVSEDEGIRPSTTMEGLSRLRPAFSPEGSTTAGNSSQVSDGAAVVLVGRRSSVEVLGLPVLAVLRSSAVVGVPPHLMGIGPAQAIPVALERAGTAPVCTCLLLFDDDIDVFEINEAFASQVVFCVEKLGVPQDKVNPNGGAIALGHPLGCTGVRQLVTLLHELRRRRKRAFGVVSMCIGTGMGAAAVFEYPGP